MDEQSGFDLDITRALSRREFLGGLAHAVAAAAMLEAAACSPRFLRRTKPGYQIFDRRQVRIISKIIDGFAPPELSLRKQMEREDPEYNLVKNFEEFIYPYGDDFVGNMRFLVNYLNTLPTFAPLFFTSKGLPTIELRWLSAKDVTRFFIRLRDSRIKELRSLFTGAKVIGLQPIYVNEKVAWREIQYPRPWLTNPSDPDQDYRRSTSFEMAGEIEQGLEVLKRSVVGHEDLLSKLTAASVTEQNGKLILETDVVVIGSGAGGSVAAAELAARTTKRVLIVEKGDFIEPKYFVQREQLLVPRVYDVEFSSVNVPVVNKQVPTLTSTVVRGKLVGGSATINHALAFETPRPVLRDWQKIYGAEFTYETLKPHFEVIRQLLRIQPVPEFQISGNNDYLRRGAVALGLGHHAVCDRNTHQCRGCGFCDVGCRYNRKLTPLNIILPLAAKHGAQLIANCSVDKLEFHDNPAPEWSGDRRKRIKSVRARLTDEHGRGGREIEIRTEKVVLSAGPMDSPRILQRSGLNSHRARKGADPAIGKRFSTHAPITYYAEFERPFYPSVGGPPMCYYYKSYESEGHPDPANDHISYAIEGIFNHPMTHAQLMPFESPEGHYQLMKAFNRTMTLTILFRDKAVGEVSERAFTYSLAPEDRALYMAGIRTGVRIMFAAGAKRAFFNSPQPLIIDRPEEIKEKLTVDKLDDGHLMVTSGHPMGGCALGGDPKRDVVDSRGKSWDVEGLYVADSSIFPTSLGANPCYTVYTLSHFISDHMVREICG